MKDDVGPAGELESRAGVVAGLLEPLEAPPEHRIVSEGCDV
jgi:hypothetical protein